MQAFRSGIGDGQSWPKAARRASGVPHGKAGTAVARRFGSFLSGAGIPSRGAVASSPSGALRRPINRIIRR